MSKCSIGKKVFYLTKRLDLFSDVNVMYDCIALKVQELHIMATLFVEDIVSMTFSFTFKFP